MYFPSVQFSSLRQMATPWLGEYRRLDWKDPSVACKEGTGDPKKEMLGLSRRKPVLFHFPYQGMSSPETQSSDSYLWICHSTRPNDTLTKSSVTGVTALFSPCASFFLLSVLVCVIVILVLRESMGLEAGQTRGGIPAPRTLSLWLCSRYLTCLCLSVPIFKIGRLKQRSALKPSAQCRAQSTPSSIRGPLAFYVGVRVRWITPYIQFPNNSCLHSYRLQVWYLRREQSSNLSSSS